MDDKICVNCGKSLLEGDSIYKVIIIEHNEQEVKGYQCQNCYLKSLPDEVWEDLDKYHQGI